MKVKDKTIFTTVRAEGAILPTDLLQRIVENDKNLEGLKPTTYHLLEGEKLNEVINRSWTRLRGAWVSFQAALEKLSPNDPGTSVTRDRLLLPLFQELGYGRLTSTKALEIEDRNYPISHGWQHTPIHLVGWRVDLDHRTAGVAGAARSSPHSLVQEVLNRSQDHLWAFLSNGHQLRILRDNVSLTRQAYVEFDLEAMMAGEVYADFVLLWLLCHQSRVEAEKPEQCWLEKWSKTAQEQGTRALDQLRLGVKGAIDTLGQGFLSHPENRELRQKLQSGDLSTQDYYRQLLRLVYRLLFLFVAEDRELLLDPGVDVAARERYTLYYSTARLRTLAEKRRGTRHSDLFFGLRLVMEKLGSSEGCQALGLPALGSLLWSSEFMPDLMGLPSSPNPFSLGEKGNQTVELPSPSGRGAGGEGQPCQITNADLLEAIRALAFINDKHSRRPVDYKNLRSEELGSVYEALLELHPELNVSAGTFALTTAAGNERKTTGSYYTPESLVQCLLDSALDPVLDEAVKKALTPQPPLPEGEGEPEKWEIPVATQEKMQEVARQLRRRSTRSEDILWEALRNRKLEGRKFRRQHPIGTFVVDFFCKEEWLIVEIDGAIHESQQELDRQRQELLESLGLRFVRVSSSLVETNLSTVLETIHQSFLPSSPSPLSLREKGNKKLPSPSGRGVGGEGINPAEQAILNLKVCDPACGSGHFLIAAAHRMAKRLATIRTGDEEPSPEAIQKALRDVIGRCIYGVDVNPMAVELCKVALWMESLEPGKPLSFLEHHIQCGNSLLGAMPALLQKGIPDEAFTPIEGDDKAYCSKFKKQNKEERAGQLKLFDANFEPWQRLGDLATSLVSLDQIADHSIEGIQRKQEQYETLVKSTPYLFSRFWADAWCAAFVWKKTQEFPYPITDEVFRRIERNPYSVEKWMRDEVMRLAEQYKFFHWHLAFPDVFRVDQNEELENEQTGWNGGFDIISGNPPWERIRPEADKFFTASYPELTKLKQTERNKFIDKLKDTDTELHNTWINERSRALSTTNFLKSSGIYPLATTKNVNSYAVFQELALHIVSSIGMTGLILQSGIATDEINKELFQYITLNRRLVRFCDFENRSGLFPSVHRMMKFCLLTLRGSSYYLKPQFICYANEISDLQDKERTFELSSEEFSTVAPNTGLLPMFRKRRDADLTLHLFSKSGNFVIDSRNDGNPWNVNIQRMFSIYYDSEELRDSESLEFLPSESEPENLIYARLYEAKLFHQFDHRFATYQGIGSIKSTRECRDRTNAERQPEKLSLPRYWARREELERRLSKVCWSKQYLMGYRDVTNASNERTCIASFIPCTAADDTIRLFLVQLDSSKHYAGLIANFNSFALDFSARNTVASTHLSEYIAKQLPILPPNIYTTDVLDFIVSCVLELTYTAWDLQPFAQDCGYNGPPFRWNDDRRFLLRCELDAAYFHLYGIDRDDVDYIMETFPIVKRKDEKAHGHYRTKDKILEIYDAMTEAMKEQRSYQTLLDPPPADPRVAHPP